MEYIRTQEQAKGDDEFRVEESELAGRSGFQPTAESTAFQAVVIQWISRPEMARSWSYRRWRLCPSPQPWWRASSVSASSRSVTGGKSAAAGGFRGSILWHNRSR